MAVFIRSRLLLLVLAWALPSLVALLSMVHLAASNEREANLRTLRDISRAMSMVVERELDKRALVARLLSASRALQRLPDIDASEADAFRSEARQAMAGLEGWVEVHARNGRLLDSRDVEPLSVDKKPSDTLSPRGAPYVSSLIIDGNGGAHTIASHPVLREGSLLANVVVVILPSELQRVIDSQSLPEGWTSTVMDDRQSIVARRPSGIDPIGKDPAPELRQRFAVATEGDFDSLSIDGRSMHGFYSTSPHGWSYLAAMPSEQLGGYLQGAAAEIMAGSVLLLGLAVAGALWVSHGIVGAVVALKQMAGELSAGQTVEPRSTGISECDDVAATLTQASRQTRSAQADLERRVAEAVQRTREVEQQASRGQRLTALGRLTGGVAHDFNNVLGVVSNSAHLVQRHAENLPALHAPVAAILRAVDLGSRLTQQLLRFAGRRPVRSQPLDLSRWVGELGPLLEQVMGKRVNVTVAVTAGTLPVMVDSGELELALLNLALNARDAMPDGGSLQVQARNAELVDVAGLPDRPYVVMEVIDTGSGMEPEVASRVFEPFFTTKPFGEGSGLGLAQVHGFCTQAGGTVRLTSVAGQGTRVSLVLPAGSPQVPAADALREPVPANALAGLCIVVVEDNDALGEATAALLQSFGADVQRVPDAADALAWIDRGMPVDAVLSDVLMPGPLDGVALGRRLRARTPPIPVVLTSGYAPHDSDALQGFVFLPKPASDQAIVSALRGAVGR